MKAASLFSGAGGFDLGFEAAGVESHRYRLCGNGVVAPVAEWIAKRIVENS